MHTPSYRIITVRRKNVRPELLNRRLYDSTCRSRSRVLESKLLGVTMLSYCCWSSSLNPPNRDRLGLYPRMLLPSKPLVGTHPDHACTCRMRVHASSPKRGEVSWQLPSQFARRMRYYPLKQNKMHRQELRSAFHAQCCWFSSMLHCT